MDLIYVDGKSVQNLFCVLVISQNIYRKLEIIIVFLKTYRLFLASKRVLILPKLSKWNNNQLLSEVRAASSLKSKGSQPLSCTYETFME